MVYSHTEQMYLEMKAHMEPLTFVTHDYFLGRKPYPMQAHLFTEFYADPKHMMFVGICGMRGGKTRLAADMVGYELFDLLTTGDVAAKYQLEEGSKFFITCVASSAEQAEDTIFHEVKKSVNKAPFFERFNPRILSNEIRFDDYNVEVKAGISSAMGLVGRTVKANVFDELSKLEKTEGKRSAELVYSSLSKSTSSFKFAGKNIVITSPLHTEDKAWRLYKENVNSRYAVCVNMPTWEMNPNLPFEGEFMQAKLEEDPITFWRDYGAIPQSAVDKFFKDEDILVFDPTVINIFEDTVAYRAFMAEQRRNPVRLILAGDPSGRMDSFGIALGYNIGDEYYVIGLKRFVPEKVSYEPTGSKVLDGKKPKMEINPLDVREFVINVVRDLRVKEIIFDTWDYPLLQKELTIMGCNVYNNVVKIAHYEVIRKILYGKRLHCCYHPVLMQEWKQLVQHNARKVDHPKLGSKDLADAVCNVVFVANELPEQVWVPTIVGVF